MLLEAARPGPQLQLALESSLASCSPRQIPLGCLLSLAGLCIVGSEAWQRGSGLPWGSAPRPPAVAALCGGFGIPCASKRQH